MNNTIQNQIGKVWDGNCWNFAVWCVGVLQGIHKPFEPTDMVKIDSPRVGAVVLLRVSSDWHAGVVWPDGLHFVHAEVEKNGTYVVRKGRLTQWPWSLIIEGYYSHV